MANRLATATSPYLLQHAENPVDWWEWSSEAFDEAKRRDVPILLSVGYAACHWCHVMAHESFEDPTIAAVVNERFVAIKVDREERPDVDAVYMQATQALTGQGGWPMTVFLTPDRRPFYAGTYFPPEPRHGLPSFPQLVEALGSAWVERRDEVLASADQIVTELGRVSSSGHTSSAPVDVAAAVANLRSIFDPLHAGFGAAPKFPPSMVLEALLRDGGAEAMTMAGQTLAAMARGGLYDQLAGGFARYSVDARWIVPHFEKMLYDNALLLGAYTHWWRRTADPLAERVVRETVDWLIREIRTDEGGFAASLDADSLDDLGHLHEGAYYVWDRAGLDAALAPDDAAWAAETFEVTASGTFEKGLSTLQLLSDPKDPVRLAQVRSLLAAKREVRSRPGRDDKVVAAWNGWLITALIDASQSFDEPGWLTLAESAAEVLWRVHWVDGRLRRTSRDGKVGGAPGILEDYAAVAMACVRLAAARTEPRWAERAEHLVVVILEQFDDGGAGFFDTAADAEALISRPQDPTDNATPSGLSSTLQALRLLAKWTGDPTYADRADRAFASVAGLVERHPRFAGWLLADAISQAPETAPYEIAIVGPDSAERTALVRTAQRDAPAGSLIVVGEPDQPGVPLLADRSLVEGRPAAYVCRGFVCRFPVTSVEALVAQLSPRRR